MSMEFLVDDNKDLEMIKRLLSEKFLIKNCDGKLICKRMHRKTRVNVALAGERKYISFQVEDEIDSEKIPLEDFLEYRQAISTLAQKCNSRITVFAVEISKILYTSDGDTFVLSRDYSIHSYITDTIKRKRYITAK